MRGCARSHGNHINGWTSPRIDPEFTAWPVHRIRIEVILSVYLFSISLVKLKCEVSISEYKCTDVCFNKVRLCFSLDLLTEADNPQFGVFRIKKQQLY